MRGSIQDVFFIGGISIGLVLLGYILYGVIGITTPLGLSTATAMGADSNATIAISQTQVAINNFLGVIPIVIGAIGLGAIILASTIPASPVFMIVGVVMLLAALVMFLFVQNAMVSVFANSFFASGTTAYPLPMLIAENIVWILLIVGTLVLIVMYGRSRGAGTPEG